MEDHEYIQWLKTTLPRLEKEVWATLEQRLKEIEFLVEERDKLTNRVNDLEKKVRDLEKK